MVMDYFIVLRYSFLTVSNNCHYFTYVQSQKVLGTELVIESDTIILFLLSLWPLVTTEYFFIFVHVLEIEMLSDSLQNVLM